MTNPYKRGDRVKILVGWAEGQTAPIDVITDAEKCIGIVGLTMGKETPMITTWFKLDEVEAVQ